MSTTSRSSVSSIDVIRMHFPPVEEETPTDSKQKVSHSAEALAAKLPDAPTDDPNAHDGHMAKKLKIDSSKGDGDRSEDDWEKVDKAESEKLDDEPVNVAKASTATDVESVSSAADLESATEGKTKDA